MLALEGIFRDDLVQLPFRGDVNSQKFQTLGIKYVLFLPAEHLFSSLKKKKNCGKIHLTSTTFC